MNKHIKIYFCLIFHCSLLTWLLYHRFYK